MTEPTDQQSNGDDVQWVLMPTCPCEEDEQEHSEARMVEVTWDYGRVDLLPARCWAGDDMSPGALQDTLPTLASVWCENEASMMFDPQMTIVGLLSDDIYLVTHGAEDDNPMYARGLAHDVVEDALANLADWLPVWELYLAQHHGLMKDTGRDSYTAALFNDDREGCFLSVEIGLPKAEEVARVASLDRRYPRVASAATRTGKHWKSLAEAGRSAPRRVTSRHLVYKSGPSGNLVSLSRRKSSSAPGPRNESSSGFR